MSSPAPLRDASTIVIARDAKDGPEIYMVKRHKGNKFMAEAYVFVGGRADEGDGNPEIVDRCNGREAVAEILDTDLARATRLYVAAIREAFEESGLLLARDASGAYPQHGPKLQAARDRLNAETVTFADVLAELDLRLPLAELFYAAHWCTPPFEAKRYDTRFFVARAPEGQVASYDERETSAGAWLPIDQVLADQKAERLKLAPPTLCLLEDLQHCETVDAMLEATANQPVTAILPKLLEGAESPTLLLPDDHRFDGAATGSKHYIVQVGNHWERVRE